MTRFDRLRDSDATDVERMLLDSASDDAPSVRIRQRTLAAMGVGGAVLGAAQGAAAKLAATGAVAPGAKGIGSVSAVLLLKWIGTGAVVGTIVAAGVATVTTPGLVFSKRAVPAVQAPSVPVPAKAVVAGQSAPVRGLAAEAAQGEALPGVVRGASIAPAAPRGERVAAPAPNDSAAGNVSSLSTLSMDPKPAASTVMAEVASLDRARTALAAGDARAALARVSAHDASFPGGALQPEAVVLRVRALVALGDRAQAASVAGRFLAAHPDSAQAGRLRTLVGER
jgi:hypothetical protein